MFLDRSWTYHGDAKRANIGHTVNRHMLGAPAVISQEQPDTRKPMSQNVVARGLLNASTVLGEIRTAVAETTAKCEDCNQTAPVPAEENDPTRCLACRCSLVLGGSAILHVAVFVVSVASTTAPRLP